MALQNKQLVAILCTVAVLLTMPLVAMQLTDEVNWTLSDFVAAGVLLFGTGLLIELVLRRVRSGKQRLVLCAVILAALLLIWAELAVGVFGTPFAGQ